MGQSDTFAEAQADAADYDIRLCSIARAGETTEQADVSFRTGDAWMRMRARFRA